MSDQTAAIAFVREIVRKSLWKVHYHQHCLPKASARLALLKDLLLKHAGFDEDAMTALDIGEEDEEFETVEQFAAFLLTDRRGTVEYHERELKRAHGEFALVQILLVRGGYSEIDIAEVDAEAKEDVRKAMAARRE